MRFSIYRYDPDSGNKPAMQDYEMEPEHSDKMLLDALIRLKSCLLYTSLPYCGIHSRTLHERNSRPTPA